MNKIFTSITVISFSVISCCLLTLIHLPGMELLGITPNWFLIWLIIWSVRRNLWQSVIAGICLGLIWDSLSGGFPTHIIGLALVALMTANVFQDQYVKEDIISLVLIVFGMVIIVETVMALQYSLQTDIPLTDIWLKYQQNALASAIITSVWTPLFYFPLNFWLKR